MSLLDTACLTIQVKITIIREHGGDLLVLVLVVVLAVVSLCCRACSPVFYTPIFMSRLVTTKPRVPDLKILPVRLDQSETS